ncbi:MAG: SseB family protein [Candidatus Nanopelagicales bacterium]
MAVEDFGQIPESIQSAFALWLEHPNELTRQGLLSALSQSRLLLPLREHKTHTGNDMVQVTFTSKDGRKALLAFTSIESLSKFDPIARPFIKTSKDLALEALEQNYDGIIIDINDEHKIALTLSDIASIANA